RLALGNGAAGPVQGAGLAVDGTGGAAVGAGGLFAQGLRLLFQQGSQGALGEASRSGAGQLLHGLEVGVQAGAALAEGASGNDFASAGGQVAEFLEEFRRKFTTRHGGYRLVLAARVQEECLGPLYDTRLGLAKLLMASPEDYRAISSLQQSYR